MECSKGTVMSIFVSILKSQLLWKFLNEWGIKCLKQLPNKIKDDNNNKSYHLNVLLKNWKTSAQLAVQIGTWLDNSIWTILMEISTWWQREQVVLHSLERSRPHTVSEILRWNLYINMHHATDFIKQRFPFPQFPQQTTKSQELRWSCSRSYNPVNAKTIH